MDFQLNLQNIKYTILEKALNILIGNFLQKQIDYILDKLMNKNNKG